MEGSLQARPRDMLRVLAALSDENRYRIIELLSAERAPLSCGAIGAALGLSPSLVSHHLAILEDVGIVDRRKAGLRTLNSLSREVLARHLAELSSLVG